MIRGIVAAGAVLAAGCAEPELTEADLGVIRERAGTLAGQLEPQVAESGLTVRLTFDPDVDLDLYVTDPLLETVYFARHESRTGGVIEADVRCDSAWGGPRVEAIRFRNPWPGRYRVGVDFPRRCDGSDTRVPAPFGLSVTLDGKPLGTTHGLVDREFFEVVVLEFDVTGEPRSAGGD